MPIDKRPLKVFLSYASQDRSLVRELSRQLMGEGWIDIWRDEKNLLPGQDWRVKIEEAVEEADVVIICLSNHSVSKEGHVQKELRYAREIALEKPEDAIFLIPLRLEECEVPRGLRFYQWVDYFGESKDSSYKALVTSLEYRYEQKIKIEEKERLKENRSNELFVDVKPLHADDESRDQFKKNEPKTENEKNSYPARRIKLGRPNPYWIAGFMLLGLGAVLASIFNNQTGVVTPTPSLTFTLTGTTSPALLPTQNATDEPDKPSCVYTVKESDTFIGIAYKFGVTMNDITCAAVDSSGCDLSNPIGIQIGWALQIPDIAPEVCLSNSGQVSDPVDVSLPTTITDSKGVLMVLVPEGDFEMGSEAEDDEQPVHTVYLDAFYMDKYEVTNYSYSECVTAGRCAPPQQTFSNSHINYYDNSEFFYYPVIYVTWNQAVVYCRWREGLLPTEAQWEKAARGTDARMYPWGEGFDCNKANYGNCVGDTTNVGHYEDGQSPYGIYDLAGNVGEWTSDWYVETYYKNSPSINPLGPAFGRYRIARGGSWNYSVGILRASDRGFENPDVGNNYTGFRCVKDVQ